jgi:hypothetical protein
MNDIATVLEEEEPERRSHSRSLPGRLVLCRRLTSHLPFFSSHRRL